MVILPKVPRVLSAGREAAKDERYLRLVQPFHCKLARIWLYIALSLLQRSTINSPESSFPWRRGAFILPTLKSATTPRVREFYRFPTKIYRQRLKFWKLPRSCKCCESDQNIFTYHFIAIIIAIIFQASNDHVHWRNCKIKVETENFVSVV